MLRGLLLPLLFTVLGVLGSPHACEAKHDRAARSIARLDCEATYESALREADKLRGRERKEARKAARRALHECLRKAKKK